MANGLSRILEGQREYYFVDGTMKPPARGLEEFEEWQTMNSLLISWMFVAIDPTLILQVPYKDR